MTKEDVENTLLALQAQGMDEAQIASMRSVLENQLKLSSMMAEDNEKSHAEQQAKQQQISKIADVSKGKKDDESPEAFEERRSKVLSESPDVIPLGRKGGKALVKDDKAATGYVEKRRRKIGDSDLQWAEEHEVYKASHPDEKFEYTPAQQAALNVHGLNKKYKSLSDKEKKARSKNNPGPALTKEELDSFNSFRKQLKDASFYIPTDDELKREQQARDKMISERSAKKKLDRNAKVAEMREQGVTIPFDGSGSVIIDFSDENVRKGDIPVQVSSAGKSQSFVVPFQDLQKFRNKLNGWSGNSQLSHTVMGVNSRGDSLTDDTLKGYHHAWKTGDYTQTRFPRLMDGLSDKADLQGYGKAYGGGRYGGQADKYDLNSEYYRDPEGWKKKHNDLVEEANSVGMSYDQYMKMLADQSDSGIYKGSASLEQAVIDAHKTKDPAKIREAVSAMLEDRLAHQKSGQARSKASQLLDTIRKGDPYESEEAYKEGLKGAIDRKRKSIRNSIKDVNIDTAKQLRELRRQYESMVNNRDTANRLFDETERAKMYSELPDEIFVAPEGDIFSMVNDEPQPTGYTAEQIFGESGNKALAPYLAASLPEDDEGYAPVQGYNKGDMLRLLRQEPALGIRQAGFSLPDKNGIKNGLFFDTPYDNSRLAQRFMDTYNEAGGDPVMEMLENFDKRELEDIIGKRNLGTTVPELFWDPVTDEEGNPVLDTAGNQLKRPRLFLDANGGRLAKLYHDEGVGKEPGYIGKVDRFKRFRGLDGKINEDLWRAYRMAVLQAAAEKQEQALEASRLGMINDFQERGGLTNEQVKNNNRILNDIVQAGKFHEGESEDLDRAAADAAAQLAASQALRKAYTGKVSSLNNMLRKPELAKQFLGIDLPEGLPVNKDVLRSIMTLSKYNRAGDDTTARNKSFDEALVNYLKENGYV